MGNSTINGQPLYMITNSLKAITARCKILVNRSKGIGKTFALPMRGRLAVTVSSVSGAHSFSFSRPTTRVLIVALLIATPLLLASIPYNFVQIYQRNTLHGENARLDALYTGVKGHSAAQESYYAAIRDRIELLEWKVDPQEYPSAVAPADLAGRVDAVSLQVLQEKVMRSSIPNGYPTKRHIITGVFGDRIHPVTKRKAFHNGIDLRAKQDPVFVTADGIVRSASFTKLGGKRIVVQHNFGFETYYAHLHKMHVKAGDVVQKGEMVGISGDSGRHSTGPHLHYEVRYLGKPLDALEFAKWQFGSNDIFTQIKAVQWHSLVKLINAQITHPMLQLSQRDADSTAE